MGITLDYKSKDRPCPNCGSSYYDEDGTRLIVPYAIRSHNGMWLMTMSCERCGFRSAPVEAYTRYSEGIDDELAAQQNWDETTESFVVTYRYLYGTPKPPERRTAYDFA